LLTNAQEYLLKIKKIETIDYSVRVDLVTN